MSSQGRADRPRSKYTSEEARNQLHNVDVIFPQYEDHFNVSQAEDSSTVREILSKRIHNIEGKLQCLENNLNNGAGKVNQKTVGCFIVGTVIFLVFFSGF